jgi:RNAse (barnase) inhibitor barstar
MTTHFHTRLNTVLHTLDKSTWATSLVALEQNFRSIPDDEISFADEVLTTLSSLRDIKSTDSAVPLTIVFAIRFAKMDVWTFRFTQKTDAGTKFLNPLTDAPTDFIKTQFSQSSSAFPAEDILKRWVRDHLV